MEVANIDTKEGMMAQLDKNYLIILPLTDGYDHLRELDQEETLVFSDEEKTTQDTSCPPDWFDLEECGLPIFPEDTYDRNLNGLDDLIAIEPSMDEVLEMFVESISDPETKSEMTAQIMARDYLLEIYQPPSELDFLYEFDLGQAFANCPKVVCLKSYLIFHCLDDLPETSENGFHLLQGFDLDKVLTSNPFAVTCRQDLPS